MFHHDFFAHKTLANVNFETFKAVAHPFMRLTISNTISFNLFPQNINSNSTIFGFKGKNIIWMKDGRVGVYILGENVENDGI